MFRIYVNHRDILALQKMNVKMQILQVHYLHSEVQTNTF